MRNTPENIPKLTSAFPQLRARRARKALPNQLAADFARQGQDYAKKYREAGIEPDTSLYLLNTHRDISQLKGDLLTDAWLLGARPMPIPGRVENIPDVGALVLGIAVTGKAFSCETIPLPESGGIRRGTLALPTGDHVLRNNTDAPGIVGELEYEHLLPFIQEGGPGQSTVRPLLLTAYLGIPLRQSTTQ